VLTATVVVLAVLLLAAALLLVVAALQKRARRSAEVPPSALGSSALGSSALGGSAVGGPALGSPALGSPAQVWLERGERVAQRLRRLGAEHPTLAGAADDADAVLTELRAAAGEVAGLDAARARLPVSSLRAEQRRLDDAIAATAGGPSAGDLRSARAAVAARLALAERHRAAIDALLVRMRAAVAGMEQAEDELTGLLATFSQTAAAAATGDPVGNELTGLSPTTPSETAAEATRAATAELADRLAGLRAGLAEVREISRRAFRQGQGQPGDLPGSVEPPPST